MAARKSVKCFQLKAKLPPELTEKWPTIRSIIAAGASPQRQRKRNGRYLTMSVSSLSR